MFEPSSYRFKTSVAWKPDEGDDRSNRNDAPILPEVASRLSRNDGYAPSALDEAISSKARPESGPFGSQIFVPWPKR